MLGLVGFSIAALVFVLYGFSALQYKEKKGPSLGLYAGAFLLTAVACLIWAAGTQAEAASLETFVIVGDVFLLAASVILAKTLFTKNSSLYLGLAALVAVGALLYRVNVDYTDPVMKEGVLVFYTPRIFGALLAATVLGIWLRANMQFYDQYVRKRLKLDVLRPMYFTANILSLIGLTGVMFARKSLTISLAFSMIVLGYLTMSALNLTVFNQTKKGVKHAK